MGDPASALGVLERAYELAPRDPFVASKYAQVLETLGEYEEALSIINGLSIAFPESAVYHHRASKINEALGDFDKAYEHAKKAVNLDDGMYEAVMRLAALELHKGNTREAETLLDDIPEKVHSKTKSIRDTIRAEMLLKEGELSKARLMLKNRRDKDSYYSDVLARIELKEAMKYVYHDHNYVLARDRIQKGIDIANSALKSYPNTYSLKHTLEQLNELNEIIKTM